MSQQHSSPSDHYDDAIHLADSGSDVTLCGQQREGRNVWRTEDPLLPDGASGCWTCLEVELARRTGAA